ncbi:MAG: hypothetical protein ABI682_10040 [Acidobacteriota bacterium]
MKRIWIGNPDFVARILAWSERDHRTPADVLHLVVEAGLREVDRMGVLVPSADKRIRTSQATDR